MEDYAYLLDRHINVSVPENEALECVRRCVDGIVPDDAYSARVEERARAASIVSSLPPGIAQRTPEWYAAREGLITASNFADAASKSDAARRSFVRRKVDPKPFLGSDATRWGVKYEDVACALYEHYNHTTVAEYGLLLHPTEPHLGASPDGITPYGVMVEIKCPYTKTLSDIPPEYSAQMQGQLEVCGLQVCDFAVCRAREFEDEAAFWAMRSDPTVDSARLGAVSTDADGIARYTKPGDSDEFIRQFASSAREGGRTLTWHHVFSFRVQRVKHDAQAWALTSERLRITWDDILHARYAGCPAAPVVSARPPQLKGFSFRQI
jgi:putative phage-type endonuclease